MKAIAKDLRQLLQLAEKNGGRLPWSTVDAKFRPGVKEEALERGLLIEDHYPVMRNGYRDSQTDFVLTPEGRASL